MSWFHRKRTREVALVVCFLLPSLAIFLLYRILPLGWNAWLSVHAWSPLKAAQFIGLEQLCLSPQCGFASTEEGNVLSEDEQWAKLRMVVDVAREVWGE